VDNVLNPKINSITIKAQCVLIQDEINGYTNIVFKNLESTTWFNKYIMCVRYPNWQGAFPQLNDIGYLQYSYVLAGTQYFDKKSQDFRCYGYNHIRFDKFLKDNEEED